MSILRSSWLIIVAAVIFLVTFWFRPGGVEGPRPAPVEVEGKSFAHDAFTAVLSAVVDGEGRVDYAKLQSDPGPLDRYLGQLRAVGPANAPHRFKTDDDRLAYYLNAYNAFVLAGVRDHCPVESVQGLYAGGGFFWRVSFVTGGEETTLSALQNERIRGLAERNAAVHFALVKGAAGDPPLLQAAYEPEQVQAQLEALSRRVVADPRFVERTGDVLRLSPLFRDYALDFDPSVSGWIARFAPALAVGEPKLEYREYDNALNGRCQ